MLDKTGILANNKFRYRSQDRGRSLTPYLPFENSRGGLLYVRKEVVFKGLHTHMETIPIPNQTQMSLDNNHSTFTFFKPYL
jgi:hypothetical protein